MQKGYFHGVPMTGFLVLYTETSLKMRIGLTSASWKLDVDLGTIYGLALQKDSR